MKTILITVVLAACAALGGAAMPTKEESERAEPLVRKLMASERAALESGKKTRAQVAAAAMKLADEADTEAAKLLLMKGAFVLYVKDGNLEKAVKTMNTLEKAISDLPPQSVTNMVETALLGLSKKEDGARLYRLLDEAKENVGEASPPPHDGEVVQKQTTVGGYTWSYRVNNGEAEIVADEKLRCAVSPSPTGHIAIPPMLGGAKVTSVGKEAFKGCGGLSSVTISENVRSIEHAAFMDCVKLISVTFPQSLRTIGDNAFMSCAQLKPVMIPANVTNVGGAAFAYCPQIKEHNLAVGNQSLISVDGVLYTKDGKELMACPSGKTSVNVLESVTNILSGSITGCGALKSLTIPSNVGIIGSWALSGSGVTSITLPQGLSRIEDCLFWGCGNLTEVTIPDSVTSIGWNAFRWCGKLTSVTMPKGVKSIGGEAFYDCGGLMSITMCGERPEAPNDVFKGCRNLKAIHVPANAKSWAGMKEWQGIPLVFDAKLQVAKDRTTVQSIIDGMIKVPGRDYWLSETELTQGQWEAVMGYNLSKHKGANLPADCVSRNDCDVFLEKLNQTKEAQSSQFVFALPTHAEWAYAAQAGGEGNDCWIKPGVVGEILDMAWMKENSSNQTHAVAKKVPNAFGFYDMVGNVYEWMSGYDEEGHGCVRGGRYVDEADKVSFGVWIWFSDLSMRGGGDLGMRLAAHLRSKGSKRLETQRAVERQVQAEADRARREAERAEQRQQLQAIREELKRVREAKAAEGKGKDSTQGKISVAEKLQSCDFLLNQDFKKNAKYYLCLFSASWCGPCRREMPRIAKMYAETLKADPDIELIHFSRDQDDEKAMAWAKEHDVKFPVVKPKGGNPLNFQSRGIPHLFIVKADGTLVEEGHPAKLFTEEKLRALK